MIKIFTVELNTKFKIILYNTIYNKELSAFISGITGGKAGI